MKTYREFHGNIEISEIGKKLRFIARQEKTSFKVMTGYGSTTGRSSSKAAALKSLKKMKKEGMIQDFFPGEVKHHLLDGSSSYRNAKLKYEPIVKNDTDYGNDGIIFIFI